MLRAPSPQASDYQRADLIILAGIVACVLAAIVAVYVAEHSGPRDLVIVGGVAVFYLAACLVLAAWILVRCFRRRIHKSPFLLFAVVVLGVPLMVDTYPYARPVIDWVRFHWDRAAYEDRVVQLGPSKVQVFYWGEGQWSGRFYLLVFDESGEVMQPGAARSDAWEKKVTPGGALLLDPGCTDEAFRLSGGFYSVQISCRRSDL